MIQFKKICFQFSLGLLTLLFFSCKEDTGAEQSFDYLVSYELIETISQDEIKGRFGNDPLVSGFIYADVDAYRITYKTPYVNDSIVEASGLVLVPNVSGKVKMMSFQHSTLPRDINPLVDREQDAPSYLSPDNAEIYLSAMLYAANGNYVFSADYIGYGSTKSLIHPYEYAPTTATTCYDMMEAANELREFLEVDATEKGLLIGYSQGGNSTMALLKYMEENNLTDKFPIEKSAMGAGAYHKTAVADYIFNSQQSLGLSISLYLWVMDTYDKVDPLLNNGLSYYLKEPYATEVATKGYFAISSSNPQEVFTEQFIADINNPESVISQVLEKNNVHDWQAQTPIKLYHSLNDGLVPYFNSEDAFNAMNAQGSADVTFETFTFGESVPVENIHGAGGAKFFTEVIAYYFR